MLRIFLSISTIVVLTMIGCTYENEEELMADQCQEVSFDQDVKPIIQNNCAVSGCHVSGTPPPDFNEFNNIKIRTSLIRQFINTGVMPPASSGRTLSDEQIKTITCWIDAGAPAN